MSVTYYTASGQQAFTSAVTISLPVFEEVLPEVRNKVLFSQRHMQTAASYTPLALSTTYTAHGSYGVPTSSSFFLVAEEGFSDRGGGVIEFDRVWATVPTTWAAHEDYAYTYLPYSTAGLATFYTVSEIQELSPTYYRLTINSSTSGIATGDAVYLAITYLRFSQPYAVNCFTRCVGSNTNWIDIPHFLPGATTAFTGVAGYIWESGGGRTTAETKVVSSKVQHDYVKVSNPGVTGTLEVELPAIDVFTPVLLASGERVEGMSDALGSQTAPGAAEYREMVRSATDIVAECTRERWRGNIYVRKTRLVPAL